MKRRIVKRLLAFTTIFALLLFAACTSEPTKSANVPGSGMGRGDGSGGGRGGGRETKKGEEVPLTVYAAASTQNAIDFQTMFFKRKYPIDWKLNYASSGQLAKQIIEGAPADIFVSANTKWMDEVEKQGLVLEKVNLISNELVIVVPKGNPEKISTPDDLKKLERIALAEPESVPAGMYAKEALQSLGVWEAVQNKVVSGSSVRTTLTYVERGEVPAGIVYATDADITEKVESVFTFPAESHKPIEYPVALLKHAEGNGIARKFFDFYKSHYTEKIFRQHGFATKHDFKKRVAKKKSTTQVQ